MYVDAKSLKRNDADEPFSPRGSTDYRQDSRRLVSARFENDL
jgi:hypothetical protein